MSPKFVDPFKKSDHICILITRKDGTLLGKRSIGCIFPSKQ